MHVCVSRPAEAPPVVLVWPGPSRQNYRMETAPAFYRVNVYAEHPGVPVVWRARRRRRLVRATRRGASSLTGAPRLRVLGARTGRRR